MRWIPFVATCLLFTAVTRAEKPNILFLFADDLTHEALGMRDLVDVDTPHLDKLARRSALFTHAYNMGSWSGAVCVASRTMLNTGRYVWRAQAVYGKKEMAQEQARGVLWSQLMKKAGYQTFMTGKWHVAAPADKAFDVARHVRGGMPKQTDAGYNRPIDGQADPWDPADPKFGGFWEGGKHWSEVVADDAIDYLQEAKERPEPFFMYIAFNAPHDPRQSPADYLARYPLERMTVPANFQPLYPYRDGIGCSPSLRDEHLAPFPRTEHAVKVHRREYFSIITHLDAQVGRILASLDASGKADKTWIVFTADHGLAVGQHGLIGKQNMYDHSVRVPLTVVGPGVEAGHTIDTPVYLQDVMPTTLELAGMDRPDHVDFRSLMPLLRGERVEPYDAIYGGYIDLQRMVVDEGYKLILYPKIKVWRLYHVADDPHELHDLASKTEELERAQRLFHRFLRLQDETGDTLNVRDAFPVLAGSS